MRPGVGGSLLAVALMFAAGGIPCSAGEHQRRFAVELALVAGDVHRLRDAATPARRRRGLRARIAGSLSVLPWLARRYLAERNRRDPPLLARIAVLDGDFRGSRLRSFTGRIDSLARRYPVEVRGLRPEDATPGQVAAGRRIYRTLCMGCHRYPDRSRENPAPRLFRQARILPETEFLARLLGGIRGTPAVALRNPLTDAEIAGLAAYLKNGRDGD